MNKNVKFSRLKYFCSMYVVLLNYQFTCDEVAEEFKNEEIKCSFSKEDLIREWNEFTSLNEEEK